MIDYYQTIDIKKEDFYPLIYWALNKFTLDPQSRRSPGKKDDKLGGFIDRFANQSVNWIIFNHLLKDKSYKITPDYFLYSQKGAKNCADILGLIKDDEIIPFTKFATDKWNHLPDKPFVEVKTFREDQNLITVGDTQLEPEHYYCLVESNFDEHYLLNFFSDDIYNYFDHLKIHDQLIEDDSNNVMLQPFEIKKAKSIGKVRLLGIYKGDELKKISTQADPKVHPYYLDCVKKLENKTFKEDAFKVVKYEDNLFDFSKYNKDETYIKFFINSNSINLNQKYPKNGPTIKNSLPSFEINFMNFDAGIYKVEHKKFERVSNKIEFISYKNLVDNKFNGGKTLIKDCTSELISVFDQIVKN